MPNKPLYVTRPDMPPLEEFIPFLEEIWKSGKVTNNGPFHQQLEQALSDYLGVEYISLCANGTIALIIALKALNISGEVITTPYSFVATAHSLAWNNIQPVFADISRESCNLDPCKIEEAITPNTTAILPVHCYGNPCDVEGIQEIATAHNLYVIYDAAHAFGVRYKNQGLLQHGDLSVLSFHATKVFNTFEGGAIICPDAETKQRIDYLKNFGFEDEETIAMQGINGKMSEFNAAFGLLQLKHIDNALGRRKEIEALYREALVDTQGITLLPVQYATVGNASYFPIMVEHDYPIGRDELYQELKNAGIHGRRYFYPLLSNLSFYNDLPSSAKETLPIANEVADKVICLPIHQELADDDVRKVVGIIKSAMSF